MESESTPAPERLVEGLLAAAGDFDIDGCEQLFAEAVARLDVLVLIREVVSPVLREAGNRWHRGELSVVQEHLLSGVVRRQLSQLLDRYLAGASGPAVLFATLSGERHEMGGLMGAVIAASRGHKCVYLGPDLPTVEIGRFCAHRPVAALALSLVTQPEVIDARAQLSELRQVVADDIEIWVAGQAAQRLAKDGLPHGVVSIPDLDGFLDRLAALKARTA